MSLDNFRYAYRNLLATPGFGVTAILSLGIGIGGNLAMFTLVNSILLKPLPYPDPDRLVLITQSAGLASPNVTSVGMAPIQFLRWRNEIQSFESLAIMRRASVNLTGSGLPETLGAAKISAEFFDTLGVKPQQGRWFQRKEEKRGMPNVAIISASLWRQRFSADPHMIGRKIILDGIPHEVIAITPPDLRFARGRQLHPALELPERADVFLPIRFSVAQEQGSFSIGHLPIARLKPGVTPAQARAELNHSLPTFQFSVHVLGRLQTDVQALQTALIGDTAKPLWLLLFAVGFVLLIACVNVANLSLMRMAQRARELSIRVALGATRLDLIRYALAESVLVALAGTASGVVLSLWITDLVVSRAPSRLPRLDDISPDATIVIFAVALCALTIVLFGMLPAWRVSQVNPQQSINAASRGNTETQRGGRIRAVLVSTEVALGTLLTIGSGLLLISLHRLINTPTGFEADNVLVGRITLPPAKYQTVEMMQRFLRGVLDQVSPTPGVIDVAATTILPLEPEFLRPVVTEHSDAAESRNMPLVTMPAVSSEYINAMGIPLRQGRFLRENEPEPVAIVNESAARLLWPGENPIGKRISRDEKVRDWLRVVGVTGDILSAGLDRAATPAVYTSYSRYGLPEFSLVVRSAGSPGGFSKALRQAVSKVDADVPVAEIRTMSELIGKWSHQRRFSAALLTAFALTAVLLAVIGIYGVVAYAILERRKEIGVRIALGATSRHVTQLVLRYGMAPVLIGLVAGVVMGMLLANVMASLLFKVSTLDPITFICAPLALALAGAVPCWLTARTARRIDPAVCLRLD